MCHERIKGIKEKLLTCIESEMCNIYEADCEELGEAVDMLKDLEEALYYCTITEAMEHKKQEESSEMYKRGRNYPMYARDIDYVPHHPYYGGEQHYARGGNNNPSGYNGSSSSSFSEMMRDPREGRSPESRRMYLESKHSGHDKAAQLRELEKYMQELTQDMVEMIQEATSEEKQYLEKKISALASKIGQMK